ncbi:MAG: GMC family oxidoreductase [Actinomycetota bacterium]
MTIRSARTVDDAGVIRTDVAIVGSGAAGITLARCLDGTGVDTLVLEAGGEKRDLDAEADSFHLTHLGAPARNQIEDRGRWFGGSMNLWFGRIALPDAIDFADRAWVPHSGWPLEPESLTDWMTVAADILEVAHFDKFDLSTWPSNDTASTFSDASDLDLRAFFWAGAPDMAAAARATIDESSSVVLLTDATAQELVVDTSDRVSSIRVVGPGGRRFTVEAAEFVLAAGGFENPRLLLASRGRSDAGLGNQHDNVGRYYLDHPRGEGSARVDIRELTPSQRAVFDLLDEKADGPFGPTQLRVVFPEHVQRSEELLNHSLHGYLLSDAHYSPGYLSFQRLRERVVRRDLANPADAARDLARMARHVPELVELATGRTTPTRFVVVDQMEQEPDRDSRVTVDHRDVDRFGLPRVSVDWRIGESTRRSQRRLHELFEGALKSVGISTFSSDVLDHPGDEPEMLDMKHPTGTTRMSASPRDGVVDADGRVHGVGNLFVVGSSTFPTAGHFNPTLLIVALTARLADHLRQRAGHTAHIERPRPREMATDPVQPELG